MEHENDGYTKCNRYARYRHQKIGSEALRIRNMNTSGDHQNDSTVKVDLDTEKSSEDLRRLAITQTLVKYHQLMMVGKTVKGVRIIIHMI